MCAAKGRGLFHLDLNAPAAGFLSAPFPAGLPGPDVTSLAARAGSTVTLEGTGKMTSFLVTANGLDSEDVISIKGNMVKSKSAFYKYKNSLKMYVQFLHLNPGPKPATQINADPDPNPCFKRSQIVITVEFLVLVITL